jgi:hypothetical protein
MSARYDWVRLTDRLTKNARIGTPRLSRCVTVSSCLAVLALRLSREMRVVQGALAGLDRRRWLHIRRGIHSNVQRDASLGRQVKQITW